MSKMSKMSKAVEDVERCQGSKAQNVLLGLRYSKVQREFSKLSACQKAIAMCGRRGLVGRGGGGLARHSTIKKMSAPHHLDI